MDPQEDDFIDACRVVDDDANVDDNFVVVSFKGYSERLDKEHYAFIPVEGVVVARAPFFRTEHISAARKLLGEPEHYYDTGNFEFQSRITDTLDPSKTYAFASELRAAGVYALSSCECTPKSTSQNVNEGTMSHLREARVMRLGHISHNYNGAFTAFRSFVDKVAATFWERMSLRGGVEYTEYPSASALEHALASGEVDFATTFGTAVAMFGTPPNWEFTYSCHTNVDVVRLVTKGITSLEALRSKVAGGAGYGSRTRRATASSCSRARTSCAASGSPTSSGCGTSTTGTRATPSCKGSSPGTSTPTSRSPSIRRPSTTAVALWLT